MTLAEVVIAAQGPGRRIASARRGVNDDWTARQVRSVLPRISIEEDMDSSLLTSSDVAEVLGVMKSGVFERSRADGIHMVTMGRARLVGIQAAA